MYIFQHIALQSEFPSVFHVHANANFEIMMKGEEVDNIQIDNPFQEFYDNLLRKLDNQSFELFPLS